MAKIIGCIGTSHVPTIGVAYDKGRQEDPAWKPLFDGYKPVAQWLQDQKADVLVFIYNDHATTFFFDMVPTFSLGVGERFAIADEGAGLRNLPPIRGNVALQSHIANSLIHQEFDMAIFQEKPIDHGCAAPLPLLWPHDPDWPGVVVPIAVNVLQYPLPTPGRCYRLGKAIRKAIESYPEDLNVVIVGTGGLSHQIHGERTGFNNTEWDLEFLELLERDPEHLLGLTHADYVQRGGAESVEQIMWLAMRGAMPDQIRKVHQNYYLATTTAMTVVVYEPAAGDAPTGVAEPKAALENNPQLRGMENIDGTYVFDVPTSNKALRLNRFFWNMIHAPYREAYLSNPDSAMSTAGLSSEEQSLVRSEDWIGMVRYGANFFVMEKFARVVRKTNLQVYAMMRGESFEDFMKTRRVPSAR